MIGALRNRLTFERKVQTADDAGGFSESWQTAFSVWGSLEAAGGHEAVIGDQVTSAGRFRVRIRYRTDASAAQRIRVDGRVLAIDWMGDPDGRRYWLDIVAVEGWPS